MTLKTRRKRACTRTQDPGQRPSQGRNDIIRGFVAAMLAAAAATPLAWADSATVTATADQPAAPGAIVGVVTAADHTPVAHATVTAVRSQDGAIRATVAGSDGTYSFADLPPGVWSLTFRMEGHPDTKVYTVVVGPSLATRYDVVVGPYPQVANSTEKSTPANSVAASPGAATSSGFLSKITQAVALITMPSNRELRVTTTDSGGGTTAAPPPAPPPPTIPDALTAPPPGPDNDTVSPFANDGDIGWMNGNTRESAPIFDTKFFTPEIRFDVNYLNDFNHPIDHTIVGSTEEFRSGEFQIEQVSFGGNFHWDGVQARFLSMLGLFAVTTPRNDASQEVGQWDLQGAYKYMSEANAGYHWDNIGHGFNIDAGIFVSYIGLFSYYNFDNWTYQPSFVSSNTPWFFNGLRIQYWPTQDLKIEPWLINGWQSYAKFNSHPGFGGQILYIPSNDLKLVFNTYTIGEDNIGFGGTPQLVCNGGSPTADIGICPSNPTVNNYVNWQNVRRMHEDDSVLWKYYDGSGLGDKLGSGISKMALSFTADVGCEYGGSIGGHGGVGCTGGPNKENFVGAMLYDRTWFDHDLFAVTLGGGFMNNPGRYLSLLPPINGATAATGTPYFTENPGQKLYQWDTQLNLQYMPKQWITWWTEVTFRHSNVPYWTGTGGVTPPGGDAVTPAGGSPSNYVCNNGSAMGGDNCAGEGGVWYPDLRTREIIWGAGVMVKF
jgi:Putative beta-barrel porin-2, OmpL-like. bbp2/Carboxypeptidase regulatory-like domain